MKRNHYLPNVLIKEWVVHAKIILRHCITEEERRKLSKITKKNVSEEVLPNWERNIYYMQNIEKLKQIIKYNQWPKGKKKKTKL